MVDQKPGKGLAGNSLIFDLALYEMDVRVLREGREVQRFAVRRAGWTTARTLDNDL